MSQDDLYIEAERTFGTALRRLARGYESDADKANDLLQEIHIALWRSFEIYEERCSLRTWGYRVAHHTAASHVIKQRRLRKSLLSLEDIEAARVSSGHERDVNDRIALERLMTLIHRLKPDDRQLMLLYLEDVDATAIGEITGISPGNVRNKIHRLKAILARRFHGGAA